MVEQRPEKASIKHWLLITRPQNLAIIIATQLLSSRFLFTEPVALDLGLALLVTSTVLIAAAGYLINDYYDIKIDYVNKPDQVIVGKYLKRRWILLVSVSLNVLGIFIGLYLDWFIGLINLFSAFFLWFYSNQLKRLPVSGNLVIGVLTATSLLIVGVYARELSTLLIIYSIFAFFMTLIREVIKDMEDYKGDLTFGSQTLPILIGLRKTKIVLYFLFLIFFGIISYLTMVSQNIYLISLYVFFALITAIFLNRLARADTKEKYHRLSVMSKNIMIFGVLSMIFQ